MIVIQEVNKIYPGQEGKVHAVEDVSLTIEQGDIFGIIGSSGAGKSTLLRMMNRLEEPTSGHIYLDGAEVTGASETELRRIRKKTGMIFQHFHLLNMKTVAENIAFPLELSKAPNKEARIDELLKLVELEDKRDSYPAQLSGGQKQRVGIARALATNPSVLFSDEATSALDPKTTQSILALLKKINRELGVTIVMITHQMEVIKQLANKVAVMDQGRIIEEGSLEEIFIQSTHPITQEFVRQVGHDLPDFLLKENPKNLLMRISYQSDRVGQPILSEAIRKFGINANILLGGIDNLNDQLIGNLIVEFSGEPGNIQEAILYLEARGITCERIER